LIRKIVSHFKTKLVGLKMSHSPQTAVRGTPALVISSIALLLLLAALDQTIVSTALPTIVADLGALEKLSWVVTSYILASTVSAPLYGKLGDLYGRRLMVYFSVGLFLIGSIACALAFSMDTLIWARALQGLGGGGLFVLALAVVGDVVAPRERGKVQGVFAAIFSASSVIGPLLGGWFVEFLSWHWIFLVNIPLGILAVIGFTMGFEPRGERVPHKIDWLGAAMLSVSLASLTLFTSLGGHGIEWGSGQALGLLALAIISTVLFVWAEAKAAEPVLPLHLFRNNVFTMTSLISLITGAAMIGVITFLPVYLQIAMGTSPTASGLLLVPMTLGIITTSTLAGRYMGRTGKYKILPIVGMTFLAIGALLMTRLDIDTSRLAFGVYLFTFGFGMGFIFPVITTAVQNAVPREYLGTATASGVMFRQIGGSIAVAMFGTIFAARLASSLPPDMHISAGELGPMALMGLPPETRDVVGLAVVNALDPIYLIVVCLVVVGLFFAFGMKEIKLANRMVPKSE
jgi:EmrB/QacA subfamily drug resistance transporter